MSDIINYLTLMKLYMYQMFSPFHCGRDNWGCETSWISNLVGNDFRSKGLSNIGIRFCELIIDI